MTMVWLHCPFPQASTAPHQEGPLSLQFIQWEKESPRRILSSISNVWFFLAGPFGSWFIGITGTICRAWQLQIRLRRRRGTGFTATSAQCSVLRSWQTVFLLATAHQQMSRPEALSFLQSWTGELVWPRKLVGISGWFRSPANKPNQKSKFKARPTAEYKPSPIQPGSLTRGLGGFAAHPATAFTEAFEQTAQPADFQNQTGAAVWWRSLVNTSVWSGSLVDNPHLPWIPSHSSTWARKQNLSPAFDWIASTPT